MDTSPAGNDAVVPKAKKDDRQSMQVRLPRALWRSLKAEATRRGLTLNGLICVKLAAAPA